MAIFSMNVRPVSMAKGSSAVMSSAYISGERRDRELTGLAVREYARAERVLAHGVELPADAPEQLRDPGELWNAAEVFESLHGGARAARMIRLALPRELDADRREKLARAYARRLAGLGLAVEWAVHDERDGNGNFHAHMLVTQRPLSGCFDPSAPGRDAFEESKTEKLYLCRKAGEADRMLTAEQAKSARRDGWEKVYNFEDGARRTLTEAMVEFDVDRKGARALRASKYPVSVKHEAGGWDTKERLKEMRAWWADDCNAALKSAGSGARVDHRSNAERGLDAVPTAHLGYQAAAVERRAEVVAAREGVEYEPVTRVGRYNAEAREANRLMEALRARIAEASRAIEAARDAARAWWERPGATRDARRRMEFERAEGASRAVGARRRDLRELLRDVRAAVGRALERPGSNVPKQVRADLARHGVAMAMEGGEFSYERGCARVVGPPGADRSTLAPKRARAPKRPPAGMIGRLADSVVNDMDRDEAARAERERPRRQQSIEIEVGPEKERWE